MPIILNGTTGITTPGITNTGPFTFQGVVELPAGAVGAPSLTTTGDTNTGIYFPAADTIAFAEGGVESMRLTSAGNVGIGTNNPVAFSNQTSVTVNGTNNGRFDIRVGGTHTAAFVGGGSAVELSAITSVPMTFATNSVERMRLDASGNLGLGVTPSAWNSTYKAMQVTGSFGLMGGAGAADLYANAFLDSGSAFRYVANGAATAYSLASGQHRWFTAPSGTAGNTISFTQAMTLDASGNLGVGTTSPGNRLHVVSPDNSEATAIGRFVAQNGTQSVRIGYNLVYQTANQALLFGTNDTERARITAAGLVGIGTSSPESILHIAQASSGGLGAQFILDNTAGSALNNAVEISFLTDGGASGSGTRNARIRAVNENAGNGAANMQFWTWNGGSDAERARITSRGAMGINTTNPNLYGQLTVRWDATAESTNGTVGLGVIPTADTSDAYYAIFWNTAGNTTGSIRRVGTTNAVAFNTSSDRRLKENIAPADSAGAVIDAIEVVKHDWKSGGHTRYGMIAQDLYTVAPEAVSVGDPDDVEELKKPWGVDYSKLVPMLVKEIQSLRARLAAAGI